jgi:hypothetical protein
MIFHTFNTHKTILQMTMYALFFLQNNGQLGKGKGIKIT